MGYSRQAKVGPGTMQCYSCVRMLRDDWEFDQAESAERAPEALHPAGASLPAKCCYPGCEEKGERVWKCRMFHTSDPNALRARRRSEAACGFFEAEAVVVNADSLEQCACHACARHGRYSSPEDAKKGPEVCPRGPAGAAERSLRFRDALMVALG